MSSQFFGLLCHTLTKGKVFPYPEEAADFQLPKRYQRDARTEAQLAAREQRIEKQKKAKEYRDSILKEREEKPIRIAPVLPPSVEEGYGQLTEEERQRQLAQIDRSEKPIATAKVVPEKSRSRRNGRANSDDSERTRVTASQEDPEEGLELGDEEDPDLVDWYGPGAYISF